MRLFFLLCLSLCIFSCSENNYTEDLSFLESKYIDVDTEIESREGCYFWCNSTPFFLEQLVSTDECCLFRLTVGQEGVKLCNPIIFIEGVLIQSLSDNGDVHVFEFTSCGSETLSIYGVDRFHQSVECHAIPLHCLRGCCSGISANLIDLQKQENCCTYTYAIDNQSTCGAYSSELGTLPSGISYHDFVVCDGESPLVEINSGKDLCGALPFSEVCEECCEDGEMIIDWGGQGQIINDCCLYKFKVKNNSSCSGSLDIRGEEIIIGPGETTPLLSVLVCEDDETVEIVLTNSSTGLVCQTIELDNNCK